VPGFGQDLSIREHAGCRKSKAKKRKKSVFKDHWLQLIRINAIQLMEKEITIAGEAAGTVF
jgi:hypothetical protein